MLELTTNDGCVIELAAAQKRTQSVPPDWPAAEGIRLEAGRPMVWKFPIAHGTSDRLRILLLR